MSKKLYLALLFLLAFGLSLFKIRNPDLGFHFIAGRFLLETFSFPKTDFSTFTRFAAADFPHSIIPSAIFYGLYKAGGFPLLCLFKSTVYALAFCVVLMAASRTSPTLTLFKGGSLLLIGSIAIIICRDRLALQPFMFTDLCLALLFLELPKIRVEPFRWRRILIFSAIFLMWFNAHLGVIHGIAIFLLFTLTLLFDRKYTQAFRVFKIYGALMVLIGTLSALANPSSANIWPHLFFEFQNSLKQSLVAEYQSGAIAYGRHMAFMGFSAIGLLLAYSRTTHPEKNQTVFPVVVFIFFMALTARYQREISHLALAWFYLCSIFLVSIPLRSPHKKLGVFFTITASLIFLLEIHYPALAFGWGLHRRAVPQKSFEIVRDQIKPARIYNTLSLGGWWSFFWQEQFPKLDQNEKAFGKIFHDGRGPLFNKEFLQSKVLPILRGEPQAQQVLDEFNVDTAMISYFDPLCMMFARSSRWQLAYFDEGLTVFTRRLKNKDPEFSFIQGCTNDRELWDKWDAWLPKQRVAFAEQLQAFDKRFPQNPRALYLQGIVEAKQNHLAEATKFFFESGEAGDDFDNAYGSAAKIACSQGNFQLANLLFDKAKQLMIAEEPFWNEWTTCLRLQNRKVRAAVEWAKGQVYITYFAFRG